MKDKLNNEFCELKEYYRILIIMLFVLVIEVCVEMFLW